MKKLLTSLSACLLILATMFFAPLAFAQNAQTSVVLQKDQIINHDYFAAGETVTVSGTVNGDAYVAGGTVIVEGTINGDLLAAGGNVIIRGKVQDDVRVVGGQILISGEIGRNLTTAGGNVTIADSAKIAGSLAAGTGTLSLFAPIGKDVNIGGGQVTIANVINGDLQAGVGTISLTSNAKVHGNLSYWSQETATLEPGSSISGKINHYYPPVPEKKVEKVEVGKILSGAKLGLEIYSFLAALLIGLLLAFFMPHYTARTAQLIVTNPLQTFGVGFLSIVLSPFIFIFLLITVLGIPLALILLAGFIILIYLAKIIVGIALGQALLRFLNQKAGLVWILIVGLLSYYILTIIPFIGFVFWMVAGLMGLGALLMERKLTYTDLRNKHLL